MVRSCFLFCWFLAIFSCCYGQVGADNPYCTLVEGEQGWTLRAETGLYRGPDRGTTLHATLSPATPLHLLERLDETESRQGVRAHWYRVRHHQQEGFVWGGDLAHTTIAYHPTGQVTSYGLQRIYGVPRGNYQEPQLELLLLTSQRGIVLDSLHVPAIGTSYTQTKAQYKDPQGLAGAVYLLEIAFSDGYCGGVAATVTLVWNGKTWQQLGVLHQGFGDQQFSQVYYKFPDEHQHGSHLVALYREVGYYNQQQQPVYTSQTTDWYEWTGCQLLQVEVTERP